MVNTVYQQILLPAKTSIRNKTGKQTNNICLQIELTPNKIKFNQIVHSQRVVPASYITKKSSLTEHLQNTSPKIQSFLTTSGTQSQRKCYTSIERKTTQPLKIIVQYVRLKLQLRKIDMRSKIHISTNRNTSHPIKS